MKNFVAGLLSLSLMSTVAFAERPTEEDLQACYGLEFEYDKITPQLAFIIGECFSELAATVAQYNMDYYGYKTEPGDLTNREAVLHYAGSWFLRARYDGHPEAEAQLMLTRDRLSD